MSELKFRAWVEESRTMFDDVIFDKVGVSWFDPDAKQDLEDSEPGCWVLIGDREKHGLLPHAILLQYVGLKDKNGKEIYKGDIIKFLLQETCEWLDAPSDSGVLTAVVSWSNESCGFAPMSEGLVDFDGIEIVGNIYENPELLEGK